MRLTLMFELILLATLLGAISGHAQTAVAPLSASEERALKPKDSFTECSNCPEMVVLPPGSFTMGSPPSEANRDNDEGPQHQVTLARPFAVAKFHITVDQFAVFASETGDDARARCSAFDFEIGKWAAKQELSWRSPGYHQKGSHPVVCLNWNDAKAYADWLAHRTGKPYRLLTEAEWEYAARAQTAPGTYPRYSFGNDDRTLCRYGNGATTVTSIHRRSELLPRTALACTTCKATRGSGSRTATTTATSERRRTAPLGHPEFAPVVSSAAALG
jgi:formylglycine-generating enzyme required for sulfatase activity